MKTFIINGDVITEKEIKRQTVVLDNGIIEDADYHGSIPEGSFVIDASGKYVSPGFVEIHAHGGGGADFMDSTDEAFNTIASTHLSHGTTSIMPTTVACSPEAMSTLFDIYRRQLKVDGGVTWLGLHLEGPFISMEMKGAQNPSYVRSPQKQEIDRLMDEAGDIIKMCTAAPEIPGIDYMAKRMRERGIVLSVGHSNATYSDMERAVSMGFSRITHLYSNTTTVRKINQVVCAGTREAAYLMDELEIELIGDGKHVAKEVLQLALKVKGADKINLTSDAMRAAGTNVSESYLGQIKPENRVIIEDGVAKLPDRSFFAGSIATADIMLRWAVEKCGVSIADAVKMLSLTPARVIGADNKKGSIESGKDADILLIDRDLNINTVISSGIIRK